MPEVAAIIGRLHARERDLWRKNRLLAIKLAASGEHSAAEVADLCGIARGHLFEWIKSVREGGPDALLVRAKRRPQQGSCRGLDPAVARELKERLAAGEFVTAVQAQRWLEEVHGVTRCYQTVWRWLKKPEECCWRRAPAPLQERSRGGAGVSRRPGGQA